MDISRESILKESRVLVSKEGLKALSIRKLAKNCGVAIGTIYNYFTSKDDLLISTIESVWEDIFRVDDLENEYNDFLNYLDNIFNHLAYGIEKYPNFFTIHSLSFKSQSVDKAKDSMANYLENLSQNMIKVLDKDPKIRKYAFDDDFSKEDLVKFILSTSLCFIVERNYDKDLLIKIIEKTIY